MGMCACGEQGTLHCAHDICFYDQKTFKRIKIWYYFFFFLFGAWVGRQLCLRPVDICPECLDNLAQNTKISK